MIEIVNGRVYVDGVETIDPTLIGYAILDFAENNPQSKPIVDLSFLIDKQTIIDKYNQYLKDNSFRSTWERTLLIELICTMGKTFTSTDFIKEGMKSNINYTTCYNFLNVICDSDLIQLNPKTYSFVQSLNTEI